MSYRPENQSIETPCNKIIEGIEEYQTAVWERVRAEQWTREHLEELHQTLIELITIKFKLAKLAQETW